MKQKIILLIIIISVLTTIRVYAVEPWKPIQKRELTEGKKYFMHRGFVIDCVLATQIFTFNALSPVIAKLEYDQEFLGKVVLPKGTKFIGTCAVEKTINRVNVIFDTIVFPDGEEVPFTGIALHTDGSGGIPGKVKKETGKMPARIMLTAVATGVSVSAPNSVPAEMVKGITDETMRGIDEKQTYSITVKKGTAIQVFVLQRIEY